MEEKKMVEMDQVLQAVEGAVERYAKLFIVEYTRPCGEVLKRYTTGVVASSMGEVLKRYPDASKVVQEVCEGNVRLLLDGVMEKERERMLACS